MQLIEQLTPTELKIAKLVAQGLSSSEVGAKLYISYRTVDTHLGNIYAKFQLRNRVELTLWTQKNLTNSQCQN
jgi:DNA-binding CsgD family transcriptional regulator